MGLLNPQAAMIEFSHASCQVSEVVEFCIGIWNMVCGKKNQNKKLILRGILMLFLYQQMLLSSIQLID